MSADHLSPSQSTNLNLCLAVDHVALNVLNHNGLIIHFKVLMIKCKKTKCLLGAAFKSICLTIMRGHVLLGLNGHDASENRNANKLFLIGLVFLQHFLQVYTSSKLWRATVGSFQNSFAFYSLLRAQNGQGNLSVEVEL